MGTDIHMVAQIKRTYSGGTYWATIYPPAWWPRDEYDTKRIAELTARLPDGEAANELARVASGWYEGRNYDLFGILANVRNEAGFAGVRRLDTGWPSIAPDRGLPDGFGVDSGLHDRVWMGDHSYTWLTLAELLAYPWQTQRQRVGVVTLQQFAERLATGAPYTTWSGNVSGRSVVTLTAETARVHLTGAGVATGEGVTVCVRDSWPVTAAEACKQWHDTLIPAFQRLAAEHETTPDKMRLVMGFDS